MITAFRKKVIVRSDGGIEICVPALKPGDQAEVIVLVEGTKRKPDEATPVKTASDLLSSGLVGLWADRQDLGDSLGFARHLRQTAEHRDLGL
ncbi:MAG: hypothetical protein AB1345_06935 [Chloroflexota bacterium]